MEEVSGLKGDGLARHGDVVVVCWRLHLGVSFLDDVRVLTLSLQDRRRATAIKWVTLPKQSSAIIIRCCLLCLAPPWAPRVMYLCSSNLNQQKATSLWFPATPSHTPTTLHVTPSERTLRRLTRVMLGGKVGEQLKPLSPLCILKGSETIRRVASDRQTDSVFKLK
ncbi:hypothetical protein EYF80_034345 [Liparis tanakae]|uniref:Uncharacterized protein n=1 Tax=Liparis tanakae TaxID=230148 RepID=A0A4Z2GRQ6_9TELE|nr:hypothetical protein EYF80_034345 [Liparis tanakae]